MPSRRGVSNTNVRGSAKQRRARKRWLLETFGDGDCAPCHLELSPKCLGTVTFDTIWVDRHPITGRDGGSYRRDNIRPACEPCQEHQGADMGNESRRLRVVR